MASILEQARDRVRATGARVTGARVKVLAVLLQADEALTHTDVQRRLELGDAHELLDRVTLYRVLEWLVDAGLAHRVSGPDRVWRFSAHGDAGARAPHAHHGHFKCRDCERMFCMKASPGLPRTVRAMLPDGFTGDEVELTVLGRAALTAMDGAPPGPAAPVPVTVLTGFLGSGKTTLLNALLRSPALADTAVLINEFGEVGIDHLLVDRLDERTVLLASGCVCCTIRGDLAHALASLLARRDAGALPPFSRIVVETTGLADPAPILHTLLAEPMLAARCRLQGVVTTVDAVHGPGHLSRHFESVKQAAVADLLVVTKADLAEPAALERLGRRLDRLNPGAARATATLGALDPEMLLGLGLYDPASRGADVRRWLRDEALRPAPADSPDDGAGPDRSRHGDAIRSFVLAFDAPVARDGLDEALGMLTAVAGDALLRVKGVVDVEGEGPWAIHAVQHRTYPPVPLPRWPAHWDGGGEAPGSRRSRIVFVVRHPLSRDYIASAFAHFVAEPITEH